MKPTEADVKHAFHKHRERVISAQAIIDNRPPLLHAKNYARFSKLKDDINTSDHINSENMILLKALNKIVRTRGEIDTFRQAEYSPTPNYDKLRQKFRQLEELEFENFRLGKNILCAKPDLCTWLEDRFKRKMAKKKVKPFEYPTQIMEKYSNIKIPHDPFLAKKYLRPKIWLNLEVKGVRPLGHIVIELYTEAAPQVVMEFVRLCFNKQKERLSFVRLFPCLWLQGELKIDRHSLIRKNIEYDKRCLDHGRYAGILSFAVKSVCKCSESFIPFAISFKPLRVCNGRFVGFGHVCSGEKILSCIEFFGTKNGKPTKEIVVSNCGVIH